MDRELIDRAWRVLSAEFRKEVKSLYNRNVAENNISAYATIETLFGLHNLTSDAEGEEMLTVSRKQVQEMYADIINDIRDYNGENSEMVGTADPILRERAAGMKAQLRRLFGSKCLPDEEPKPAEPKDEHNSDNTDQKSANVSSMFDTIIKDSFREHNRLNIAAMAMQAIITRADMVKWAREAADEYYGRKVCSTYRAVAKAALAFADDLIAEADSPFEPEATDEKGGNE